jgi:hypothetical protein
LVVELPLRQQIAVWAGPEKKARFAALAASRGLSQSKLLGLLVDAVLARNQVDSVPEAQRGRTGRSDRVSLRLRPGDGRLLRQRAQARGMKYTTYAAVLIRAHLRTSPPMPFGELAMLERSLAEVSAVAESLGQIARAITQSRGGDTAQGLELSAIVPAVERLWRQMREVVKANVLSWECADGEAS